MAVGEKQPFTAQGFLPGIEQVGGTQSEIAVAPYLPEHPIGKAGRHSLRLPRPVPQMYHRPGGGLRLHGALQRPLVPMGIRNHQYPHSRTPPSLHFLRRLISFSYPIGKYHKYSIDAAGLEAPAERWNPQP